MNLERLELIIKRVTNEKKLIEGREQHITSAGIDSLSFLEIIIEIEEDFGISLPDDKIFKCKTFGDIMELIENNII